MAEVTRVLLRAEGNLGYGADQIEGAVMTLLDLQNAVEQAVYAYGEDAEVVLFQTNNRYGANFGRLDRWDLFAEPETEDEDEEDEE